MINQRTDTNVKILKFQSMFTSDSDEDVIDKVLLGNVKTPKILNLDLILPSVTDNLLLGSMRS